MRLLPCRCCGRHRSAVQVPTEFALHAAYPNPFNPATTLPIDLPEAGEVTMVIYDLHGHVVARAVNGYLGAGRHWVTWTGRDEKGRLVSSGIYFARLVTSKKSTTIKIMLLK